MKLSQKLFAVVGAVVVSGLFAIAINAKTSTAERIKPIGELCMEGESCASAPAAASGGAARSADSVYQTGCAACHAMGIAGAPKTGDAAEWNARIEARGLEGLYTNAYKGFNGMPPKGVCADCSEEEIKATVDYMLAQSK